MLLSRFNYARPETAGEAVQLLAGHENARVLAGGQSLINVMKMRVAAPDLAVDVGGIPGLSAIRIADGRLELGATATYAAIAGSADVLAARPVLAEVVATIADVQVRNRGTIGGNICSNDPANHLPPLMVALGAEMEILGRNGSRTVTAKEFFEGVYLTAVRPGELLTSVRIPAIEPGEGDAFAASTIGAEGTPIVDVAAAVRLSGETIERARVAIGCVAAVPVRARALEDALAGARAHADAVGEAAAGLGAGLDPPGDVHASAGYRRRLAEVLAADAVAAAIERARAR